MTDDRLAFDRALADALEHGGPHRAPTTIVPGVLQRTARQRQTRVLAPLVDRRMWPPRAGSLADPATWRTIRMAVALATVAVMLASAALIGVRLTTPPPVLPYRGDLTSVATLSTRYWDPRLVDVGDGNVLIIGGAQTPDVLAEVVDVGTGQTWAIRWDEAQVTIDQALRTPDGRVVGLGRRWSVDDSDQLGVLIGIDPGARTARVIATVPDGRAGATLAARPDGSLLVIGGERSGAAPTTVATVERFDPIEGTFKPNGELQAPRAGASATTLDDGRILVVGGSRYEPEVTGGWNVDSGQSRAVLEVEVFDPTMGTSTIVEALPEAIGGAAPLSLADRRVLLAGPQVERCGRHGIDSVESFLFDSSADTLEPGPRLPHAVSSLSLLGDGSVLMVGMWTAMGPPPGGCDWSGTEQAYVTDAWIGTLDVTTGATRLSHDPFTGLASLPGDPDVPIIGGVSLADGRVVLATWDINATENPAAPTEVLVFE